MKKINGLTIIAMLAMVTLSCMTVNRAFLPATPTAVATSTPVPPSETPSPVPSITPTVDYCPNGDCISACVKHIPTVVNPGSSGGGIKSAHRFEGSRGGEILVTYDVTDDRLSEPQDSPGVPKSLLALQGDRTSQKKIWEYFTAIIPPDQRRLLDEYDVFTDGKSNILAAVMQSDARIGKWVLIVDIQDAVDPQDLTYTLIHEFGHLLTLNTSQVLPSKPVFENPHDDNIYRKESDACTTYFVGEGCSLQSSYIYTFFQDYWTYIYPEWQEIDSISDRNKFYTAVQDFYEKYKDQFVTDYAPTSPEEDIAESFSYFILKDKPEGNTIADQKVLFFYQYPELVQLRSQIARRLCDQLNK